MTTIMLQLEAEEVKLLGHLLPTVSTLLKYLRSHLIREKFLDGDTTPGYDKATADLQSFGDMFKEITNAVDNPPSEEELETLLALFNADIPGAPN